MMDRETFDKFCEEFRDEATNIMTAKNADYRTGTTSQLHYEDLAKDLGITPMQAWSVLFMKHVHAILRYARDGRVDSETIRSRLLDVHNYAILGAALIESLTPHKKKTPVTSSHETVSASHDWPSVTIHTKKNEKISDPRNVRAMLDLVLSEFNKVVTNCPRPSLQDLALFVESGRCDPTREIEIRLAMSTLLTIIDKNDWSRSIKIDSFIKAADSL